MTTPRLANLLCALLLCGCSSAPQSVRADGPLTQDTSLTDGTAWYARMDELPRHYRGVFQWDKSDRPQQVEIWFESVGPAGRGDAWLARGRGVYRAHDVTHIDIKARIHFETGEFQMWEANPDSPGFTTDGSHIGRIHDGFRSVEAIWTGDDGNHGKLRLTSVDAGDGP